MITRRVGPLLLVCDLCALTYTGDQKLLSCLEPGFLWPLRDLSLQTFWFLMLIGA